MFRSRSPAGMWPLLFLDSIEPRVISLLLMACRCGRYNVTMSPQLSLALPLRSRAVVRTPVRIRTAPGATKFPPLD